MPEGKIYFLGRQDFGGNSGRWKKFRGGAAVQLTTPLKS
jgi:hypothetical protein